VTHLFNAMPPGARDRDHRAALAERRLTAGPSSTAFHVDPFRSGPRLRQGADRIALVTDAMPTVGTSLDRFELMGRTSADDGRLTRRGTALAGAPRHGSAVRNAVRLRASPGGCAARASLTPRAFSASTTSGALVAGVRAPISLRSAGVGRLATWLMAAAPTASYESRQ
jgi:N-acetylglucosamine-6-phosphate deacetylase